VMAVGPRNDLHLYCYCCYQDVHTFKLLTERPSMCTVRAAIAPSHPSFPHLRNACLPT
jgi:hypothetical protein